MQPSLAPLFEALSRHLLALKWQDDMAAEEAADAAAQEAQRQALLEELLNEEEAGKVGAWALGQARQMQRDWLGGGSRERGEVSSKMGMRLGA